ncbi:MAG: hypothetical protein LAN71_12310 [Acidobacteriia bacterium]|nr:hypothetical protein [Terriglobia bacterium]
MRDRITALREQSNELLAAAEGRNTYAPKTSMHADFWEKLKAVCALAREMFPGLLVNIIPDESTKTWNEAVLCLRPIVKACGEPDPESIGDIPGDAGGIS